MKCLKWSKQHRHLEQKHPFEPFFWDGLSHSTLIFHKVCLIWKPCYSFVPQSKSLEIKMVGQDKTTRLVWFCDAAEPW